MLTALVNAALRFRMVILALAAGVLALGVVQLPRASVDALPEYAPPYVEVQTEALGLSAEEVEQLITVPLEADLLNGIQDVDVIRSESLTGLSRIVMVFDAEVSQYEARARVQEKLTQAHALPQVSKPPTMLQPLSSTSRLLMVSLESATLTPIQGGVLARWTVKPRLMGIPGVANVAIWGQQERQLQVQVDPNNLAAKGVTLEQIVTSTGNAQIVSPLSFLEASTPGTGGFVETAQQRLQVIHVFDKLATVEELAKIPVDGTKGKLRLGDVATVVEDHQPLIGDAVINGKGDGLMLVVEKFPNANPRTVTAAVEKALAELQPGLSGMQVNASIFRSGNYVASMAANLGLAVGVGLVLMGVGVWLWFLSWRTAAIALATAATALTATALILHARGDTFNAITFVGLGVAATLIAYDSIRVSQSPRVSGTDRDSFLNTVNAAGSPLGYGLLIGIVTILPLAVMDGAPGRFLLPAVVAYLIALGVGFVIQVALAPALEWMLVARTAARPSLSARVAPSYGDLVVRAARGKVGVAVLAVLAALAVGGSFLLPRNLVPDLRDRDLVVTLNAPPGTSLPAMNQLVVGAIDQIKQVGGVESTAASVGRAVTGDQIVDVNSAQVWVRLSDSVNYDEALAGVTKAATGVTGLTSEVAPYASKRVRDLGAIEQGTSVPGSQLSVLTGSAYPLTVRIYGEDPTTMSAKANEIKTLLAGVPGVKDPQVISPGLQNSVEITVDLDRAKQYGVKPGDVRRAEAILVQGIQVGSIFEGQKVFDVIVQGTPASRASVDAVKKLVLNAPSGGTVTLDQVADVTTVQVPTVISRDSVARKLDVVATVEGNLDTIAAAVEDRVSEVIFPLEHHAAVLTSSAAETMDLGKVVGFSVAAVLAMFLLFQAALGSWSAGATALLSVAAAVSGGVAGAIAMGGRLGAWFGLLALVGIASRNALQLKPPPDGAADRSAGQALASHLNGVLGSSLGAALLVLPFAVMGGLPGMEILQPFAIVVLCGLVTATASALLLPATMAPRPPAPAGSAQESRLKAGRA